MPDRNDTLKKIAEDAFLLAHNVREGDLGESGDNAEELAASREWRTVELIIDIGERLARVAGIPDETLWKPDGLLRDLIDAN